MCHINLTLQTDIYPPYILINTMFKHIEISLTTDLFYWSTSLSMVRKSIYNVTMLTSRKMTVLSPTEMKISCIQYLK